MRSYKQLPLPKSIWKNPLHFIAFGFGSGAVPFAPGTFGTALAIPFYLALQRLPNHLYGIVLIFLILASMWLCDKVSRDIKVHDHPGMNIDEFIGFFVTMFAVPSGILWIAGGFILFRIFDILKPWPIRQIDEKVHGGIGMILDDVMAGLYACAFLHVVHLS